jgi:hypothetical protein
VETPPAGPEPGKRKAAPPADRKSRPPAAPAQEGKRASVAPVPSSPGPVATVRPETKPPSWTLQKERLAFRVDFLGITMGYARFQYAGRVSIGGKTAYRINVRAWTSGVLAYLYPINETIEYYLDTENIQPIRIEYTGRKNKRDDAAVYDQETGKILYRYLDNGEIRKTVDAVPSIHDPVSVIYYFRWRDMGREDRPVNLYGGRKVYQIASRVAGNSRLTTESGPVDTLVVEPVIRREGKLENKGDLRMWVTNDERRIPVRIYGKFRKIREWTLIGELLPERPGG